MQQLTFEKSREFKNSRVTVSWVNENEGMNDALIYRYAWLDSKCIVVLDVYEVVEVRGWVMGGQWDNNDIIMLTFWSRFSSFLCSSLSLVPRPACLQPPPPHSVHRARLRRQLGLGNRPRCASWRAWASEDASVLPCGAVDQAGAALYGLPPALAV